MSMTEQQAPKVPLFSASGERRGDESLPATLFGAPQRGSTVHQAVVAALANARQGTAQTRNRSRVSGGGAKPWRQKGTGRARQGSIRAPHWRHGAVVFGPNGRKYEQRAPRKLRQAALAAALSAAVAEGRVAVIEEIRLEGERPTTKGARSLLDAMGMPNDTVLVGKGYDAAMARAFANLPNAQLRTTRSLRLTDVLVADHLVFVRDAVAALLELRG